MELVSYFDTGSEENMGGGGGGVNTHTHTHTDVSKLQYGKCLWKS
jgi:hypothetical protein